MGIEAEIFSSQNAFEMFDNQTPDQVVNKTKLLTKNINGEKL